MSLEITSLISGDIISHTLTLDFLPKGWTFGVLVVVYVIGATRR